MLASAAKAIEKTKENLARSKEERPPSVKRPLTKSEAEELREVYTQALTGVFEFADKAITFTNGAHQEVEIWSTIDEHDIGIIVDVRLSAAQQSVSAARSVKRTIWAWRHAAIGMILGPRFIQTWQVYADSGFDMPVKLRRPPKKLKVVK